MNRTINTPYVTEKSMKLASRGQYTFVVDVDMQKTAIKALIADMYNVHVLEVKTVKVPGKTKRRGKKMVSSTSQSWKKAIVRLSAGEKILAFEIPSEPAKEEPAKK